MPIWNKREEFESEESFKPAAYNATRGITASAARIDPTDKREVEAISKRRNADTWQEEAWDYYDLIGEIKHSAGLIANVLSRVNLYAAYVTDSSSIPARITAIEDLDPEMVKKASAALSLLETGNGGTSGLLRNAALNLFVVGECYLVKEPAKYSTGEPDKWQIRSIDEVTSIKTRKESIMAIKPRKDSKQADFVRLPQKSYVARMWRNHPRYSDEADSSLRGLLDICDELLLLSRTSRTLSKSKLAAGIFYIPDEISNMADPDSDGETGEDGIVEQLEDTIEEALIDALTSPIEDETSAASIVPLIFRGPAEFADKLKHITFDRAFDAQATQRIDRLIDRILSGLDIPRDVAAGLSGVKYSNAILIEEQLYKAHVEPLILMIVDCLTVGFLRPALRSQGFSEEYVSKAVIWYDPSAITSKPSKSESANIGLEQGVISDAAWRRAHGFSETDAPTQLETAQRMAKEKGILNEALTEKLISTIIPADILAGLREEQLGQSDPASQNALQEALGDGTAEEESAASENVPEEGEAPGPAGLIEP